MKKLEDYSKFFVGFAIAVFLILWIRLAYIQLYASALKERAEQYIVEKKVVKPPRGLIYDRYDSILVANEPAYDIMVVPARLEIKDTKFVASLLGLSVQEFKERLQRAKRYSRIVASPILSAVHPSHFHTMQTYLSMIPGFTFRRGFIRKYYNGHLAHVVGYMTEVSKEDLEKDSFYMPGDFIGRTGLEHFYELELRGQKGIRYVLVDAFGRERGAYANGKYDIPPVPGKSLYTTIDPNLQSFASSLMEGKRGAIVAIEPATGEILAFVSSPDFSLDSFWHNNRSSYYVKLLNQPDKPLFNRGVSATYPPGSTIKPLQTLFAFKMNVINHYTSWFCPGAWVRGSLTVKCHGSHFLTTPKEAIQHSCNSFYCEVFYRALSRYAEGHRKALMQWKEYLNEFGFGKKTGVDIRGEKPGLVPDTSYYDRMYGTWWKPTTIISLAIGQGEWLATPIQLATYVSVIANGGWFVKPHFVRKIDTFMLEWDSVKIDIPEKDLQHVRDGMKKVIEEGTARIAKIPDIEWAGKTGTAQNPHGEDHSLFVGFAPLDSPRIAVAVMVENGGFGSRWAAPIASFIVEYYLKGSIDSSRLWLLERVKQPIKYEQ